MATPDGGNLSAKGEGEKGSGVARQARKDADRLESSSSYGKQKQSNKRSKQGAPRDEPSSGDEVVEVHEARHHAKRCIVLQKVYWYELGGV